MKKEFNKFIKYFKYILYIAFIISLPFAYSLAKRLVKNLLYLYYIDNIFHISAFKLLYNVYFIRYLVI